MKSERSKIQLPETSSFCQTALPHKAPSLNLGQFGARSRKQVAKQVIGLVHLTALQVFVFFHCL